MYKERRRVLPAIVILVMSLILTLVFLQVNSFADVKAYTTVPEGVVQTVKGICSSANNSVSVNILECSTNGRLSFDNDAYIGLSQDNKKVFMEKALSTTRSSGLGVKVKNQIYNFISQQDTTISAAIKYLSEDTAADFASAMKYIRPFGSPISTFMAVVCIIIFMFLGLGILIDVAYLALPSLQLVLEHGRENDRPWGVSTEAWKSQQEVESDMKYTKSTMTTYLKRRIPVIFIIAVCLGYIVSGKIYDVLSWVANAF